MAQFLLMAIYHHKQYNLSVKFNQNNKIISNFYNMQDIYRYNNEFDKDVICNKLADIEEKIQAKEEQEPSEERNNNVRELMYAQLMQGMRLCTGYRYF